MASVGLSQIRLAGASSCACGDPGWIRTIDLPLRRRPLYPLSYGATSPFCRESVQIATFGCGHAARFG